MLGTRLDIASYISRLDSVARVQLSVYVLTNVIGGLEFLKVKQRAI
jgi:hypothetical protein